MLHQHVREQQRERLVPHQLARAPHGVSETERQLLTGEACGAGHRQVARQRLEIRMPLALDQCVLEFELPVEVILDHALVAAGDEDEMLDAGLARLVNDVLDQRPIEHRQHFLGHRLGRGEEPGAQPGHGKNGFAVEMPGKAIASKCLAIAEVWACKRPAAHGHPAGQPYR